MSDLNQHLGVFIRKMESIFALDDEERAALVRLPMQLADLRTKQDVVRVGDRPTRSCLLLEGLVCRYLMVADGERQITSFHVPGEMPDLQSLFLRTMDHTIGTLGPCKVGFIKHEDLVALMQKYPRIGTAFWRETLIDAAIFREWMAGIGRRDALMRVAHLMCEMFERYRAVGLVDGDTCPFPVTQTEIGDALGLSTVHVNRTLQELRGKGLIALSKATLTVKNWEGLKRAGDFDPTYLHQDTAKAA